MKRWLLAGGIVLLLVVGLAAVALVQLTRDTRHIEGYLSSAWGREVRIGRIEGFQLGRQTSFTVEEVSVANPEWAAERELFSLRKARAYIDLFSLVRSGPIIISELEVSGLRATLLAPADHAPSWQLFPEQAKSPSRSQGLQLPVVAEQAHITDSHIIYRDPLRELQVDLSGQLEGGQGLQFAIDGQSRGHPVSFAGHASRRDGGLAVHGEGQFEEWVISLNGTLADPFAFSGLDARLGIRGDYALPAGEDAGTNLLPLELDVQLSGSGSRLDVPHATLRSGDSQLSFNGTLGNPAALDGLVLELVFNTPDLKRLLPLAAGHPAVVPLVLQGELRYIDGALQMDRLLGRSGDARLQGLLRLPLEDNYRGAVIEISGAGESLGAAVSPWTASNPSEDAPFAFDLEAAWEPPVLKVHALELEIGLNRLLGRFAIQGTLQQPQLSGRLQLSGRRARHVLGLLGSTVEVPDEPFMVKADLVMGEDGSVSVSGLEGQLARSDLHGEAHYVPGAPARLQVELHSKKLDLQSTVEAFQRQAQRAKANDSERSRALGDNAPLTAQQLQERMIPDTPLRGDWLQNLQGKLSFSVGEMILRENLASSAEFRFAIADGVLVSEKMAWGGGFSSGSAELELRDAAPGLYARFALDSRRLPLIWLLSDTSDTREQAYYRAALTGQGTTLRQLAASLDGTLATRGGGGRLDNRGLMFFFGDVFGEIFAQLNPQVRDENYTDIECHAGILVVTDGLVDFTPGAVLRTDKLDIAMGGTADLNNERLNLVFNTRSRTGVGISASKAVTPYLMLGGNFSYPRLGVNTKGVVISGGAAVATGGLSILAEGLWDRWVGTATNPCDELFEQADEASAMLKKMIGRP